MAFGGYDAFDDPYAYQGTAVLRNKLGIRELALAFNSRHRFALVQVPATEPFRLNSSIHSAPALRNLRFVALSEPSRPRDFRSFAQGRRA